MLGVIARLAVALVIAVVVYLVCIFIGGLMALMNISIAAYVGDFIVRFAALLAVLAFILAFFRGPRWTI